MGAREGARRSVGFGSLAYHGKHLCIGHSAPEFPAEIWHFPHYLLWKANEYNASNLSFRGLMLSVCLSDAVTKLR